MRFYPFTVERKNLRTRNSFQTEIAKLKKIEFNLN